MKFALLALSASLALAGCASVKVVHTDVASGRTQPRAIYIRSQLTDDATFRRHQADSTGERPLRRSLIPAEFSQVMKEELEKMAPARVLQDDETAPAGWLVESDIRVMDGGSRLGRGTLGHAGVGQSKILIHVRVTDVDGRNASSDAKKAVSGEVATTTASEAGAVIYEFDLAGGSRLTGRLGALNAPGLGEAARFDLKNAAERVLMALSVDPHRYGTRSSPLIR